MKCLIILKKKENLLKLNNINIKESIFTRIVLLFLVLVAWYSVTIMSFCNPSFTIPMNSMGLIDYLIIFVIIPLFLSVSFNLLLKNSRIIPFFIFLFILSFICGALVLFTASMYHRDYFTLFFQLALLLFASVIIQFPDFIIYNNRIQIIKVLTKTAFVILTGCLCWIMLMGYSIATREEPRWLESIVYNIVNVFILGFLAFSIGRLQQQTFKILHITSDSCRLNERNLSLYLSDREISLLYFFIQSKDNTCTCSSIFDFLSSSSLLEHPETNDCVSCMTEKWSAINCKFYRNIKNQLTSLKKSLELVEIGTIVNMSTGFRDNKNQGWKIKFFNDVIVSSNLRKKL